MGFKSIEQYNKDKYGKAFVLKDDGHYADVIILHRSIEDILIASGVHYITSESYSGYVHCLGKGCPACNFIKPDGEKGLWKMEKLFIPLYNIAANEVQYFDRSARFETQYVREVFTAAVPDPTQVVYRITRKGVAGDIDTKYHIQAVRENNEISFEDICEQHGVTFPEFYTDLCKSMDVIEMQRIIDSEYGTNAANNTANTSAYGATPRVDTPTSYIPTTEESLVEDFGDSDDDIPF